MKKIYAVIDTNVLVSSMLKHSSIPGKVMDYVVDGTITPLLNQEILREYTCVLFSNKFGFAEDEIAKSIRAFYDNGLFIDRIDVEENFIDKDDVVFYEITMSARSTMDTYLVTGNLKHFPNKKYVVSPRQIIEIIENI